MSLQFDIEEHPRLLVSLSYAPSVEDMNVDSITSVQNLLDRGVEDDEIQVLTSYYYENPPFVQQLTAGRAKTTDLTQSLDDLSLPADPFPDTIFHGTLRRADQLSGRRVHPLPIAINQLETIR